MRRRRAPAYDDARGIGGMSAVQDGRLGKYEIVGTLGRGAMGTVYDGRDPVIDRRVAIKTIPLSSAADDAEAAGELARFKREAQAAGRLHHPNIVGVYDYGETETLAYIVMEFVDGTSLKSLLDRGERVAPAETARMMQQLLAGMQYSHERGVVHRDIKPANVMLTAAGVVKIADFGIARIESSSLTQAGTIMGTPAYMSPEQFMGQTVDARTDIYSAGVLLYQLLTGERPFEGSMTAIMHKALNTAPPRPSEMSVTSPPGLDAVVATAMAKRPEQRYQTAQAFATALAEGFAAPPPPAVVPDSDATMIAPSARAATPAVPPTPIPPPAAAAARGSRTPILAGVGVAALLVAGGAGYLALRPGTASAPARQAAAIAPAAPVAAAPEVAPIRPPPPTPPAEAKLAAPATPPPAAPPAAPLPVAASTAPAAPAAAAVPTAAVPTAPVPIQSPPEPAKPVPAEPGPATTEQLAAASTPAALRAAIQAAIAPVGCALLGGDVAGRPGASRWRGGPRQRAAAEQRGRRGGAAPPRRMSRSRPSADRIAACSTCCARSPPGSRSPAAACRWA